jgi:hypothetical protein
MRPAPRWSGVTGKEEAAMNRCRAACVDLGLLVAVSTVVAGVARASAQTSAAPSVEGTVAVVDMTGGLLGAAALIASFVVIGVTVKLVDLRQERSEGAAALQARIADALLGDPMLSHLPISATAHRGPWRASLPTIEVRGRVPSPLFREAALSLVMREAFGSGVRFRVVDQIVVTTATVKYAA